MPGAILIVEDHPEQAILLERILRMKYGKEIIVAEDGMTGLRLARKLLPDALLADLMLPDINGFDVCRQLRMDRETMLMPIIFVTALSDMRHRIHGFRVGANAYVTKPYGVSELFEAIEWAQAWRSNMEQRPPAGEVKVELNSEITLLKDLNDFLLHICRTTPLSSEEIVQLRQAVMEMAHNAMEWENLHRSNRLVRITYRVHENHLEIVVGDQEPDLDRNYLPHAAIADDPFSHLDVREKLGLRAGGFGLLICQGIVDAMRYNEQDNEVTLIKRFAQC
jgi:DNA-binding response OmpR family regulator